VKMVYLIVAAGKPEQGPAFFKLGPISQINVPRGCWGRFIR
jgi:hypothetical protein